MTQNQTGQQNRLREMGVLALFSADDVDLSRMISKPGVAVDDVVHQTFIEVTESGTEAAAATVRLIPSLSLSLSLYIYI